MSAVHTTAIHGNARHTAPARPLCTTAVAQAPSRSGDNGWD
ncbi:hypothetical protein [Streptomyces sp. NBC_00091]|nr:hypothetical protein [Streptomyces sp. NBC_00091]